jgi:drug/metabolite transporter (DMT)-like permease
MEWLSLTIASAVMLGFYDVFRKLSVRDNAVPIVLLATVSIGALVWLPSVVWNCFPTPPFPIAAFRVLPIDGQDHVRVMAKSILVGLSWSLAFSALKHLPLSIAGPIRSTSPMWTILIAVLLLGEQPTPMQWIGLTVVLGAFYAFSLIGRGEGIHFTRDRWVGCMMGATVLGSISSIYDKYLLQTIAMDVATLQAWFSIYLVPVMLPLALRWYGKDRRRMPFQWRWTIPLIAICLLVADYLYFSAVRFPGALISIISPVRRSAVLIPFVLGTVAFGEPNFKRKAICIVVLLAGVALLAQG